MTRNRTILIVDDDADDREILKDAFAANGLNGQECVFIENGDKLIEYLEENEDPPALIILDLNMPGKDGRETLRDLKRDNKYQKIPILVFTTSSSTRDRIMSYELGANCFITKPDTFNRLVELAGSIKMLWLQ